MKQRYKTPKSLNSKPQHSYKQTNASTPDKTVKTHTTDSRASIARLAQWYLGFTIERCTKLFSCAETPLLAAGLAATPRLLLMVSERHIRHRATASVLSIEVDFLCCFAALSKGYADR